jgi:hypothetical protein
VSSYFRYCLNFDVRPDAPDALHRGLTAMAAGAALSASDMADLPPIIADYLSGEGFPGDGVQLYALSGAVRMTDQGPVLDPASPHARWTLSLVRTFHDDEYYNGGNYFPYWLMQFVMADGPIGTRQQINGVEPHAILTRIGGDIIISTPAYAPGRFWPIPGQAAPDDKEPLVFESHDRFDLAQRLRDLDMFRDGMPG